MDIVIRKCLDAKATERESCSDREWEAEFGVVIRLWLQFDVARFAHDWDHPIGDWAGYRFNLVSAQSFLVIELEDAVEEAMCHMAAGVGLE